MNKLTNPDTLVLGIPALIILILGIYFFFNPAQYTDQPLPSPEYISNFTGSTPEEIQNKLVDAQEKFVGSIDYKYTNPENIIVNIYMINNYTGDDSVVANDKIYTAQKEGALWKITGIKSRWKCRGRFFENWTTSTCS